MSETRFVRDAFIPLAAFAQITSKMKLATAVINPYTRNPVLTAVSLATLDELSGGRAIFGIGAGSPTILSREGVTQVKPLQAVRETIMIVESLLKGKTTNWKGRVFNVNDVTLYTRSRSGRIPVYIGATGPRMLKLAGKIADGVLLNSPTSPEYVRKASKIVKDAAESANRRRNQVEIASCIECAVAKSLEEARAIIRPIIATYLANFPAIAKESGVEPATIAKIKSTFFSEGPKAATELIEESIVDSLSVSGTEENVTTKLKQYTDAGVELPVVFPHGTKKQVQLALKAFATSAV